MSESRETLVILNPQAARSRRAWPGVREALEKSGLRFSVYETRFAEDATLKTREALREGFTTIAVVGGDGTLSETAAGFFEEVETDAGAGWPRKINQSAALAVLPAGTGDDFARGLAGRREPASAWAERLIAHAGGEDGTQARAIDVIAARVGEAARRVICLNVSTIGIGADVAARVAVQGTLTQRFPGEARFLQAAFGALLAWRERRMRVTVDDKEEIELSSNLIAVANNVYAGGGMKFAPDARTDDGLMDLLLSSNLSRTKILRELPRIRSGGHLQNPNVRLVKARSVRIEPLTREDALPVEADGNPRGHTPAEFRIIPAALRIVV